MNENMSAGKIFVRGVGIVGLIGAAIYIYRRVKEAQKPIEIALDEGVDESTEIAENLETTESCEEKKTEKKAAISDKISNVSKRIGKSVGTFCLRFGAKHPKITKGLLRFGRYIPYAALGIAVLASLPFYNRARDFMEGVDPDSMRVTEDGLEFTRNIPITDAASEEMSKEVKPWVANWDEKYRDNYNKVTDFAKTLELEEGEMYIIEDQKQYNVDSPDPCVSHLVNGEGVYPPESEQ